MPSSSIVIQYKVVYLLL